MSKLRILGDRYAIAANETPRVGGMAEIFRAVDMESQGQPVAIKMFKAQIESDRHHLEAYARECQALQRLDHPNIVKVLDVGQEAETGRRYLVLEWLETPLTDRLADSGGWAWERFYVEVGKPVLEALSYAYGQGVLHRDLKPQNILLDSDGIIKVADFGISKLRSFAAPGVTVAHYRSEPYAPPEHDDGRYTETRDVYSFAVLALCCVSGRLSASYDDVYRELDVFTGPESVRAVLSGALAREREDRFQRILDLEAAVASAHAEATAAAGTPVSQPKIGVYVSRTVAERLGRDVERIGLQARRFVIEDLNESCGIARSPRSTREAPAFNLYAAQYRYEAVVSESRDALVIKGVFVATPSTLEYQRDSAFVPEADFVLLRDGEAPPSQGRTAVSWLIDAIDENDVAIAQSGEAKRSNELFRRWAAILHAKSDLERQRETPIEFQRVECSDRRATFHVRGDIDEAILGQPRLVEVGEGRVWAGEVESVRPGLVEVWMERSPPRDLPRRGRLLFDNRAGRVAITRQRHALDAIRFGRSARRDLKDLLERPGEAKEPGDAGEVVFAQAEIDESKQDAVRRALGTDSFLVVEGPPGTGKTKFISEVVVQTLRRSPEARILLTSQTHVALDNALEGIRGLDKEVKLVRIGHRHDPRISETVTDLLLETRVEGWLETVRVRSEAYVKSHAAQLGVDSQEIALGMAAARLRAALLAAAELEGREGLASKELETLLQREAQRVDADNKSDTYYELKEAIREAREVIETLSADLEGQRKAIRSMQGELRKFPDVGGDLADAEPADLKEWEEGLLEQSESSRRVHKLLRLAEEWHLRFGRSRDFHAALIVDSDVVAGTCIGFTSVKGMQEIEFDLCIVDEASKASVTELLVPLSRSKRWILVGDRNQLPPFVEDALQNKAFLESHNLSAEDLRSTLLEKLAEHLPEACVTRLVHQHRMVRPIGDLVSHCFYDGQLKSVNEGEPHQLAPALGKPVTWLSTSSLPHRSERRDGSSYKNLVEVRVVKDILRRLSFIAGTRGRRYSVAVLAGYLSQVAELQRMVHTEHRRLEHLDVVCNTVDAFQGREADVAVYSLTRSNDTGAIGFLRERRRLNVALSRAKLGLAIVGDAAFARSIDGDNPWSKILDYVETHPNDCMVDEVTE